MKANIVALLGIGLIFFGMIFLIMSSLLQKEKEEVKSSVAVGGFIGPIPFGFLSNKKMLIPFLIVMSCLAIVYFVLRKHMV